MFMSKNNSHLKHYTSQLCVQPMEGQFPRILCKKTKKTTRGIIGMLITLRAEEKELWKSLFF